MPFGRTKSSATIRISPVAGSTRKTWQPSSSISRAVPLVIRLDAVGGIGEPDGVVRFHDDVVRAVEPLALVAIGDGDDRTVELGAADAAPAMLAAEEPSLAIDGVAVGVAGGVAKDADGAAGLVPAELAIVRDIAPDERAPARRPGWSLRPGAALEEPVDAGGGIDALAEPGVEERKLIRGHAIPFHSRRLVSRAIRYHGRVTG